jgi:hypothetical protein
MKKLHLFCILLICCTANVSAGQLQGTVRSERTGEPLQAANIEVRGAAIDGVRGAAADPAGGFPDTGPAGRTL